MNSYSLSALARSLENYYSCQPINSSDLGVSGTLLGCIKECLENQLSKLSDYIGVMESYPNTAVLKNLLKGGLASELKLFLSNHDKSEEAHSRKENLNASEIISHEIIEFSLDLAAKVGDESLFDRLMRELNKKEINLDEEKLQCCFKNSVRYGHIGVVDLLLSNNTFRLNVSADNNYAIRAAAQNGHLEVVNRLLALEGCGIDPAVCDNYAIGVAAQNGHLEVVNRLLELEGRGIDPAAYDNYAIRLAAENGHLEVVNRLLALEGCGIDPAARDNDAIRAAAQNGHLEMVNRLLELEGCGIDPAACDNAAIVVAAEGGHLEVVNRLLELEGRGIDPAARNNYAIRLAAQKGHLEVVKRLLQDIRVYAPTNFSFMENPRILSTLITLIEQSDLPGTIINAFPEPLSRNSRIQTSLKSCYDRTVNNVGLLLSSDLFSTLSEDNQAQIIKSTYTNAPFPYTASEQEKDRYIHNLISSINRVMDLRVNP